MITAVDTIPKPIRDALGIRAGTTIDFEVTRPADPRSPCWQRAPGGPTGGRADRGRERAPRRPQRRSSPRAGERDSVRRQAR